MYRYPVNLFVVLSFFFLNPMYAISICAILNFFDSKINYLLFSIMFAWSFTLYFFLRDWRTVSFGSDASHYIQNYQVADSNALSDIFFHFLANPIAHQQGPLWSIYLLFLKILLGGNPVFFVFIIYFIMLLLTAYLGKLVGGKRFVVVIFCIICVNSGFLYNVNDVWRHTYALLLFLIGLFLFETHNNKSLSRMVMYSSAFIHNVAIPLVIFYEIFIFFVIKNMKWKGDYSFQKIEWNSFGVIAFALITGFIIKGTDVFGQYMFSYFEQAQLYKLFTLHTRATLSGFYYLFNPLSYVVIFYLWFNRSHIDKNDIFIAVNYFAFILAFIFLSIPDSPIGRVLYFFMVGASILASKLILQLDFRLGIICILVIIWHQFFNILGTEEGAGYLATLLHGEYLNPVYGLATMITKYDSMLVLVQDNFFNTITH